MKKLLLLLAFLPVLFVSGHARAQWDKTAPAPIGASARQAAAITPRYYTPMDFGARMDARQFWAQCSMTSGSNVLTCGATTTVTGNITATQGSRTLSAGSSIFTNSMVGQYFSATALGAPAFGSQTAGALSSLTLSLAGSTFAQVADPSQWTVSAQSTTFTFNSLFSTATDPGKTIYIGMNGINTNIGSSATAPYVATISSCSSANSCVLSVNATSSIPGGINDWVLITIGTDDSTACTKAVQAAFGRQDRFVGIPSNMLAPTCSKELEWVIPLGEGAIFFPPVRRFSILPEAGNPAPPEGTVVPAIHFANTRTQISGSGGAKCVITGDSLNMLNPAIVEDGTTEPALLMKRLSTSSPKVKAFERAVGGQTEVQFDATPSGIGSTDVLTTWGTNTSTPWLGSPSATSGYIYSLTPDCIFIGFGNNDAQATYSPQHLYNYVANIQSWSHPVDIFLNIPWPKDLGTTGTTQDTYDSIAMLHRTFAQVNNFGYLDFNKTAIQYRDGYDPTRPALVAFPFVTTQAISPFSANNFKFPVATTGYSIRNILYASAPTWFAAAVSGSPTGVGEIMYEVGCNLTAGVTCGDNIVRIGIDNTAQGGGNTGNAYVECDVSYQYPGAGCRVPGGNIPVTPTALLTVSISASSNSLTTSQSAFTAGDEGNPLVIPGAGPTMQNGFKDYLLCNMHFVSATNVTCFTNAGHGTPANAATALSAVTMSLERGNPHIVSSYSISSDATSFPNVGITINGDSFDVWYEDPNQFLANGHVVRYGGNFQPQIWWTGSSPQNISFQSGGFQFVEQPSAKLTTPVLTSFEVNGAPTWTGDFAANPPSTFGGGADNHPTSLFGETVIGPVIDANNLCATCQ